MLTIGNISFEIMHIGIIGIFILLEAVFIKKRKKAEWIFPMVILAITLAFCIRMSIGTSSENAPNLGTFSLSGSSSETQITMLISAQERKVIAVGQIFAGDAAHREYIDVDIRDDKLIGSEEAMVYKEKIEDMLGNRSGSFTGTSLKYQEIRDLHDKMYEEMAETGFSPYFFKFNLIRYMIPVLILPLMYLVCRYRRKKKNTLKRAKLEDL